MYQCYSRKVITKQLMGQPRLCIRCIRFSGGILFPVTWAQERQLSNGVNLIDKKDEVMTNIFGQLACKLTWLESPENIIFLHSGTSKWMEKIQTWKCKVCIWQCIFHPLPDTALSRSKWWPTRPEGNLGQQILLDLMLRQAMQLYYSTYIYIYL